MTSTNIDYVDTYFEFPTLTKIHGEPTYFHLKELKNELKANAASVTSDLGGGSSKTSDQVSSSSSNSISVSVSGSASEDDG